MWLPLKKNWMLILCIGTRGQERQILLSIYSTITHLMQTLAGLDHSKHDCLLVAILSHGVNGKLYSTDGELIPVETITE